MHYWCCIPTVSYKILQNTQYCVDFLNHLFHPKCIIGKGLGENSPVKSLYDTSVSIEGANTLLITLYVTISHELNSTVHFFSAVVISFVPQSSFLFTLSKLLNDSPPEIVPWCILFTNVMVCAATTCHFTLYWMSFSRQDYNV